MKSIFSKTTTMVALAATLLSFSLPGGEGFEIYLNNKVVTQQFGSSMNSVKSFRLSQRSSNDQLTIKYHHCGQAGKNRTITIKDAENKVLKLWRFADATASIASATAMNCSVKEILHLNKGNESTFKLYYASSELPNGRLLSNIIVENNSIAGNK